MRRFVRQRCSAEIADAIQILYGGRVKPQNAGELLLQPDIDGALVGGASLKASDFLDIVKAANRSQRSSGNYQLVRHSL